MSTVTPSEPLSQVVFVHDYFQLLFQGEILSVYNKASLHVGVIDLAQGDPGFCDALVALIDQKAIQATPEPGLLLVLEFASGAVLRVHTDSASSTEEAFSFLGSSLVVEQNR